MDTNIEILLKTQKIKGHILLVPMNHPPQRSSICLRKCTRIWKCSYSWIPIILSLNQKAEVFIGCWVIYQTPWYLKTEAFDIISIKIGGYIKAEMWKIVNLDSFGPKCGKYVHYFFDIFSQLIVFIDVGGVVFVMEPDGSRA